MRIHCLLPFLQELKSICGPARLLLFLRDKLVVRRQLKRFRKNRNCSLAQESIHLAAVTLAVDGGIRERRSLTPFKTKFVTRNVTQILKNIQIGK